MGEPAESRESGEGGGDGSPQALAKGVADRDPDGRVQFHYTLIAVRGIWQSGEGAPADDAAACAWVSRADIEAGLYPTFPTLLPLFDLAVAQS